jgi:DNA (cytosine-5)-methyltransferase 1
MAHKKTSDQISYNMSRIKSKNTTIELRFENELRKRGFTTFEKNKKGVPGKPDFVFAARKVAVFCDGDFWHGYNWEAAKEEIHSNQAFWIQKIEKNMNRDRRVNSALKEQGWTIFRFWGHDIKKSLSACVDLVEKQLRTIPDIPYKTIDLCAGIGGIRKGFEMTHCCTNVLAAEIDNYACLTYEHLFGDNPRNDLTTDEFKQKIAETTYDILLAGFPCQTFSRVGKEEGFDDETKGKIFFHIAQVIRGTRPMVFFLENVERLVTHDDGKTIKTIIDTLVTELGYHIIGVDSSGDGGLTYNPKSFIRNSRDFGVPQNRPRTYIIGFDTERFSPERLKLLPKVLPIGRKGSLYQDLNDVLDKEVEPKYYMASGYFDTLVRHRERQEKRGYGFGYRIVNDKSIEHPVANTLLATGGSGRERNLIYDPREGIAGTNIKGKKSPLNDKGIRVMTPNEWGKLQGFVNYAFINENGADTFSFPNEIPDAQRYKQFGNSVTIPVIEEMAKFIIACLEQLKR